MDKLEDSFLEYIKKNSADLPFGYAYIEPVQFEEDDYTFSDTNSMYGGIRLGIGRFYKPITHIISMSIEE